MAYLLLESSAVSAFCESTALMLSAGIQTEEAVSMLAENMEDTPFKRACESVYSFLIEGDSLAGAMRQSGAFQKYAVDMVEAGERSGRLENVLHSLGTYYDEEDRLFSKISSSIGYPAALLCVMTIILAFTVATILPVFVKVYEDLTGSLTAGSFSAVNVSIIIGWVAFGITLLCAIVAVTGAVLCRSENGRYRLTKILEVLPFTKDAMYQLALSRFTSVLSTYVASGVNMDDAMYASVESVTHKGLRARVTKAYESMIDLTSTKSLAQAITDEGIFEPVYARMLTVGSRSGSTEDVLDNLSVTFVNDAIVQLDQFVDNTEPALAAFLTIAVGATLIAVMIPLIGVMGAIG